MALLTGCVVTPLSNRIEVGYEAFVVVVGEGADGNTDLFAAPAEGGVFRQLTYTRVAEDLPRLGPTGTRLAFIRRSAAADAATTTAIVMQLKTGIETEGVIPTPPAGIHRLGWSADGDTAVAIGAAGVWIAAVASPLVWTAVSGPDRGRWEAAARERLGNPEFATVTGCRSGSGLCVMSDGGEETRLSDSATEGCRWGPTAVGYLQNGIIEVRPLGVGRLRQPTWTSIPANLRRPTHHPGSAPR